MNKRSQLVKHCSDLQPRYWSTDILIFLSTHELASNFKECFNEVNVIVQSPSFHTMLSYSLRSSIITSHSWPYTNMKPLWPWKTYKATINKCTAGKKLTSFNLEYQSLMNCYISTVHNLPKNCLFAKFPHCDLCY